MDIRNIHAVPAFTTKDGSEIRELLAHRNSCIRLQSLAEASLPPGASTTPHHHARTEEIYYILEGQGLMRIGPDNQTVSVGDAIAIPPGHVHQITNIGDVILKFLCCCAPAYEHDDTILEETEESRAELPKREGNMISTQQP
jgi:mannose-6-phosphate isomerase-like protein (cupin superfamily)